MASLASSPISTHTYKDVASLTTSPLLGFLLNFARSRQDKPRDVESGAESEVPDVSAQDEKVYTDLINSDGLSPVSNRPTVTVVGAGISGLVAAYELKRAKFKVRILEASSRVGGRIITRRDPEFAPGLHAEGGAMRIPANHYLLREYIRKFNIDYYRGGTTLTYDDFNKKLRQREPDLLSLFPNFHDNEKGQTVDDLFFAAVEPVVQLFQKHYAVPGDESTRIRNAYQEVTKAYDKYTLRSYLTDVAGWSTDALNLYDLGNAHVVFENGFIESWKHAFLSSNTSGADAGMQQLQNGMDQVPKAFISPNRGDLSLAEDITYGARVIKNTDLDPLKDGSSPQIELEYETPAGFKQKVRSDYVVLSVPYTAQRAIAKSKAFSPAIEQAIRDVRYIEIAKVLLQYSKRWWEHEFNKRNQGTDGGLISDLPIRYTMFPVSKDNEQFKNIQRGAIMVAYTFQQDSTILASMTPERRIRVAAENLHTVFPEANSLDYLEAGASQAFPTDELAGGSAFNYFAPKQKTQYLETMRSPDWAYSEGSSNYRVFFAGEHASYTHGWIHGAMEAGLRCAQQAHTSANSLPSKQVYGSSSDPGFGFV
ncbi:hypothetical protein V2G26_002343 [Clonostachys chloroleuca]